MVEACHCIFHGGFSILQTSLHLGRKIGDLQIRGFVFANKFSVKEAALWSSSHSLIAYKSWHFNK